MGDNIKEIIGIISGRGILGSLYIGTIIFWLLVSISEVGSQTTLIPWIQFTCFIIGYIITQITYEMMLPFFRWKSSYFIIRLYNKNVNDSAKKVNKYDKLRELREELLASSISQNLKDRIIKDENIRQILTHLIITSLLSLLIVHASIYVSVNEKVRVIELIVIYYILVSSLIGFVARSCSFGRNIAIAKNIKLSN
ncbi:hypothetical protein [Aliarcobacter butzleri]|uniref:hypothetical protein n=1 Tax=Aliarcobacter butzleri TaxID=28197 RepID=UPI00263BEC69|nr:hypothetical protein [Aliarcobacter butzleri]MDN5088358.1 hypothetical protein [Aliarcobacter butzleri]